MNMARTFAEKNLIRNVMNIYRSELMLTISEKTVKGYEEGVFVGLCLLGGQDFMCETVCV